jgi:DNA-binding NarL/FixJ family response regulator
LGQPARAAGLFGAAEALREALHAPLAPIARADYERDVAAARAQVDGPTWKAAWAEGRAMTMEQAVTEAEQIAVSGAEQIAVSGEDPAPTPVAPAAIPQPALQVSAADPPAGLTEREVEVLRLVARGLTNREVGERLFISPHTVNMHLRSIFGKLEVSTRAEATRFAVERRLV